ncbi:hypothetical protein Tco_0154944 [Tanacetum coccineum]
MHGEEENAEDVQMADHLRPMEELLQVPIAGIKDVIVVSAVLANEFELKIELLDFISNNHDNAQIEYVFRSVIDGDLVVVNGRNHTKNKEQGIQ